MKQFLVKMAAAALLTTTGLATLSAQYVKHERLLSFEEPQVPAAFSATQGQLSISDKHFRDGKHSMLWQFEPRGTLTMNRDLQFELKDPTGKDLYLSAFIVWVYNEKAMDKTVDFQFLKDGEVCTSFPFNINFTGWRGAWVCYERDMQGTPQEGMNEMRIVAPDEAGALYIDHLIPASKVDARQQTPDFQVPFVNKGTKNHWLVIYENSFLEPTIPLVNQLTQAQIADMQTVEKRFRDQLYTPAELTAKRLNDLRKKYDRYEISYKDGVVTGLPIYFIRHSEAYERMLPNWDKGMFNILDVEMTDYFNLMRQIAFAYHDAKDAEAKKELRDMFMAMYDNITDQGVAYGSCWGNIHHYGYSVRGLYPAYFLMKDVLREEGKLADAEKTLRWYAITNEIYPEPTGNGIDMDTFNTQCPGRMASILIMEDTPEKLQYLQSFSRWLDSGCLPALGLRGSFKDDGGAHHHCNNYPAYAIGGLGGATQMIYLLSRTGFAVSEEAHSTVKNVLLTMRFYCNKHHFPLAMSGRHPDGRGKLVPMQYAMLAMAGTPDGQQAWDPELAAAFLRLVGYTDLNEEKPEYVPSFSKREELDMAELMKAQGFLAEPELSGNLSLPSGCVSVQRRDNWSAVVRGHSRYLWAAEHYLGANLYGRYLAHGSMQLMQGGPGEFVTPATSGWQQPGFDWNRIPGTTTIHLPYDQLKANVMNVDKHSGIEEMLYSDEAFAGGLSQTGQNGNFGMVLHEHDKYNGTHRARKSYHFFDDRIVCLGSDIENENTEFPTETTLFQSAVVSEAARLYWDNSTFNKNYTIDHLGTGYYTPTFVRLINDPHQKSRLQNTGKETEGSWVSLIADHGIAPKGAKYEYMVWPKCDEKALKKFAKKPTYKVIQQDRNAHIVYDEATKTTSYILFETPQGVIAGRGLVQKADTACLVMVKESKGKTLLTVAQPDLALYRGPSDEAFDENGKRIERSIYSRPWKENDWGVMPVTLTLKGRWKVNAPDNCKVVSVDKNETVLYFDCKGGKSYDVELLKD